MPPPSKRRNVKTKRWQFAFRGRNVLLRDVADKVLRWLDRFKPVGDVVANVDPLHAGLPWAGIRMILEVQYPCAPPRGSYVTIVDCA